ncbi:MAG: hypothetical protein AB1625_08205 [Acidobacteriota bacterium]
MRLAVVLLAALILATDAAAQYSQYTAPGSLGEKRTPTKEQFERAMETARWQLGPLRLAPWFSLHDVSYQDNVYGDPDNPQSDFTATAGAGLHGYLPVGPKLTLGLYALPEYVWWNEQDYRRGWNWRYGAGVFGYFNRLTVEARAADERRQDYVSYELEQFVNVENRRYEASVELRLLERLSVFARGREDRLRYPEDDSIEIGVPELLGLDRDERHLAGGLRYAFRDWLSIGVGVDDIEVEFARAERDRSHTGKAPFVELRLDGKKLRADVLVAAPDLEPTPGSQFVPFDDTTGRVQLGYRLGGRMELQAYGGRSLGFALYFDSPYLVSERAGVALQTGLGWRTVARAFWEQGEQRYVGTEPGSTAFLEDFDAYGAQLSIALGRSASFDVHAARETYDSPFSRRTVDRVTTSLRLGGSGAGWW